MCTKNGVDEGMALRTSALMSVEDSGGRKLVEGPLCDAVYVCFGTLTVLYVAHGQYAVEIQHGLEFRPFRIVILDEGEGRIGLGMGSKRAFNSICDHFFPLCKSEPKYGKCKCVKSGFTGVIFVMSEGQ